MNHIKRIAIWPLAAAMTMALVAGCSTGRGASAPAPTPTLVARMAPACAPPEAAVEGETALATWAASAGRPNTLAGSLTFDLRGGSVSSVDLVVGTADAVSDPFELSRPASAMVLARGVALGMGETTSATYSFSIEYTPKASGSRLPVFALIRYTTGSACHGADGVVAQPLGWIGVN